jgi:uncharacterized protein Smg (DUF494 family)
MMFITRGELYYLRDTLLEVLSDEGFDSDDIRDALALVEKLIYNYPDEDYEENLDLYLEEDDGSY